MEVIDEQGRLFGLVNVIDALVVLLVAAVVVAGIALVAQGPETDDPAAVTETRYATVSFGALSPDIADAIETGDRLGLANGRQGGSTAGGVNVTDVYRAPTAEGDVFVVARVAVTGQVKDGTFVVGGTPFSVATTLTVVDEGIELKGDVRSLRGSDPELRTGSTPVVLETTVPAAVAQTVTEGEVYRVGTATGATVASVTVSPTGDPDSRLLQVGLRLETLSTTAGPQFAGRPVRVGEPLVVAPDETMLEGTLVARGTTTPPGTPTNATITVTWHNVNPTVADAVDVGAAERLRGPMSARVVDKRVSPETVILRTDNGTIRAVDHPRLQTVTLTVAIEARRTEEGLLFHGRRLLLGRSVVLDFGSVTVDGSVTEIESNP